MRVLVYSYPLHFCCLSKAPPGLPRLHIQAYPTPAMKAATVGAVGLLAPAGAEREWMRALVKDRKTQSLDPDEATALLERYQSAYSARIRRLSEEGRLDPYWLQDDAGNPLSGPVALCCSCSVAAAAQGQCHRTWAAVALAERGAWTVYLDGKEVKKELLPEKRGITF